MPTAISADDILIELNEGRRPVYIDAKREDTILKRGKNAGQIIPRWHVLLRCPECKTEEWRRLDYARRAEREARPHLCTGCSQSARY